jgi:DNA-binding response OmpR family regulator
VFPNGILSIVSNPLILFIEDEPSICVAVKRLLERYGFTVRIANTYAGGVAEVRAEHFDAVVIDFWLRRVSGDRVGKGDELYRELVAIDDALAHRVIFVTGDPSEPTRQRMADTGSMYLLKPFEIGLLVNALHAILQAEGTREATRALESSRTA